MRMWLAVLSCTTLCDRVKKMMSQWVVMVIQGGRFDRVLAK